MVVFPNQKIVVTDKAPCNDRNIYGVLNIAALKYAASVLSGTCFKLYVRMMLNQNGFTYALSPKAVEEDIGLSDKCYRTSVKELIEKGFLVKDSEKTNVFHAIEDPTGVSDTEPESQNELTVKVSVKIPLKT